jgi:hypothetical protein
MKARFKTSGSQAQMRQAAEFKMVPLFEYLKLKEMITHQRNQIEELASRFVMMGGTGLMVPSTHSHERGSTLLSI